MLLLFLLVVGCSAKSYNVTVEATSVTIECKRYYDNVRLARCSEAATFSWDGLTDNYPFESVRSAYLSDGLSGLALECERACGATNTCRAYRISSAQDLLAGRLICDLYTECDRSSVISDTSRLYVRQEPFNCFVKATSVRGVHKNFNDNVNPFSQISRLLRVETKAFEEVHVQVNGVTDLETFAYRPYNSLGEYCEPDDVVGCLLNSNIIITTSIFVVFVGLISTYIIILATKKL